MSFGPAEWLAPEYQQRRLYQRVRQSRAQMTAPIGITASVVELALDGQRFDTLTRRIPSEEDITEAIMLFRESKGLGHRLS